MPDIECSFYNSETFFYISFQKLYEESKCHHLVYSRCVKVDMKQVIYRQSHVNSAKQFAYIISRLNVILWTHADDAVKPLKGMPVRFQ